MANIAFLINQLPDGGVERVTLSLISPLSKLGHKIFIFVHRLYQERITEENLPVHYIALPYQAWENNNAETVERGVKENDIELFISPLLAPDFIFELKKKALCKVAFAFHSQPFYEKKEMRYYVKHQQGISRKDWLKNNILSIYRYHTGYYERHIAQRYRRIYDNTDAFGTLFDEYSKEIASSIGIENIENSKFCTLQNPVPMIDSPQNDSPREKRILYVGRLSRRDKRVDRLLMAWKRIHKRFPEWRLSIIGEGEDKEGLTNIVAKYNLPRVEFLGYQTNPEKFYATSEILCLASDFEGFGLVLVEAQMRGCAPVAFDCSAGVRSILSPNWEVGVHVPNGDIKAYAEALARLISDDELRHKIQSNGLENAKRFSIEESVKQYDAMINKLCSK